MHIRVYYGQKSPRMIPQSSINKDLFIYFLEIYLSSKSVIHTFHFAYTQKNICEWLSIVMCKYTSIPTYEHNMIHVMINGYKFQLLWTHLENKGHVATMEEIEHYYMHSVKNNKLSDLFVKVKLWGLSSSINLSSQLSRLMVICVLKVTIVHTQSRLVSQSKKAWKHLWVNL